MKRKCITIRWRIEDVRSISPKLTDKQCMKVLLMAKENHDAEFGINWGILEYWIDELYPEEVASEMRGSI